jgi:fused signal recognition particle receptor
LALEIFIITLSSLVLGGLLVFIAILIQWHFRKAAVAHEVERAAAAAPPAPAAEREARRVESADAARPGDVRVREAAPAVRGEPPQLTIGLRRTRQSFLARLRQAITGGAGVEEVYAGLEEALISADVGVEASLRLTSRVRTRLGDVATPERVRAVLKDEIASVLEAAERPICEPANGPFVVMMVGVNGVGKTTTLAKLAARLGRERGEVIVAAADTFRAAAIEQLEVWCERVGAQIIKQKQGADPAAVAFDAVKAAVARGAAVVLVDTAGRLQTKTNLMEELKKIARVIGRELPGAPHEIWIVLDATTGQNALSQAKIFSQAVPLTGVVLAKLDSTAKGGIVVSIAEQLKLPVRFVGLGESLDDLRPFSSREFVDALFEGDDSASQEARASDSA